MNKDDLQVYLQQSKEILDEKGSDLSVTSVTEPFFYPFVNFVPGKSSKNRDHYIASAVCVNVTNSSNNHSHNVIISYTKEMELCFWCGDNFFEGVNKVDTHTKAGDRVSKALKGLSETKKSALRTAMMNIYGSGSVKSDQCHFWQLWMSSKSSYQGDYKKICKHVAKALNETGEEIYDKLKDHLISTLDPLASGSGVLEKNISFLNHYAFRKPVIVEGNKGSGKTFMLSKYLDELDHEFIAGHECLESIDLLGYFIKCPDETGQERLVWKDGALTSVFRKGAAGTKCVLFFDEIRRTPQKQLSILTGALTPDHQGYYRLRTGRPLGISNDGIASEEELKVHKDMIWVVATTNVGMAYNIEQPESAFEDRFMCLRLDTNRSLIMSVLSKKCEESNLSNQMAERLLNLYDGITALHEQGCIENDINIRHICEIIEFAKDEEDVKNEAKRTMSKWVGRNQMSPNGEFITDQVESVNQLLSSVFS